MKRLCDLIKDIIKGFVINPCELCGKFLIEVSTNIHTDYLYDFSKKIIQVIYTKGSMEIKFQTKEQSNQQQQDAFLKLSKVNRIYAFLHLMERMNQFPVKNKVVSYNDNFLILIPEKKL